MKLAESRKMMISLLSLLFISYSIFGTYAYAQTLDSVSHIHHVKAVENKVLVLTHEGLYELVGKNKMILVGKDKFDVMGFTTLGKALLASGHPSQGSMMPNPIGLVKSIDGGSTWKAVSLVGKVDFHFLEGAGSDLYGADSQSGNLMYSKDSGNTWSSLGINTFTDIAVSPVTSGMAIAIKNSELLLTKNAFKSTTKIKNTLKFTQIEWRNSGLYGLSGTSLYKSSDSGKAWKKLNTFKGLPEILSTSDQLMLVTVGSDIYTSTDAGRKFKIIS
ncbi:MAG: hypothetical protein RIT31_316 [Actinomycetota bacterium]|jgi:photosystem II stability/assembly factor-like uncharacterized protein